MVETVRWEETELLEDKDMVGKCLAGRQKRLRGKVLPIQSKDPSDLKQKAFSHDQPSYHLLPGILQSPLP